MARWDELASYLRNNYTIAKDEGTLLVMRFDVGHGRSQDVMVSRGHMDASNQEWASIASGFAEISAVDDVSAVLREASEYVVGGVVAYGSTLAFRHVVPLATLDIEEFTEPFALVMRTADALEQVFGLSDRF